MAVSADAQTETPYRYNIPFVIGASAAGTTIEWYDFYLYGVLATLFAAQFYPPGNDVAALLATLATFGAGFAVRPFGAVFFGRIGDLIGRKFTFLVTISLMGGATVLIGILPTYDTIGLLAPILLVLIRLLQGLALGGEYGGAAIYVAEHSPDNKRGLFTSWIQTTATLGLLMALLVIGVTRVALGEETFSAWGWRIPFLLSAVLVGIALYIRLKLRETPLFTRLKDAGNSSTQPLKGQPGQPPELGSHPPGAIRHDGRPGGGVVHGSVLRAALPADVDGREVRRLLHHRRCRHRAGDPVLHLFRLAERQNRTQADHPGRLPDRGDHVLPDLQPDEHLLAPHFRR